MRDLPTLVRKRSKAREWRTRETPPALKIGFGVGGSKVHDDCTFRMNVQTSIERLSE